MTSSNSKMKSSTQILEFLIAKQRYNLIDSCLASKNQDRLINHGFGQTRIGILILESYNDKNI